MTGVHYAHRRAADQMQGLHYSAFRSQTAPKCLNSRPATPLPASELRPNPRSRVKMAQHPALSDTHGIGAVIIVTGCFTMSKAFAQSVDCQKAATVIEHAIYDDKRIAELDVQLAHDL